MVTTSIISVASLENSLDCSPDYYQPNNLRLSKQLRARPFSKIRAISYVTDGEHGSPDWDINSKIRYVAAEHVLANALSGERMRTISAAQDARNARCRVQKNDVLVYSVGAYAGLAARAEPHLFPASIPRSVAIIRLKTDAPFRAGFVSVFLNTEFGQFQTRRLRAGNSQPVLALEKIRQIELPHIPIEFQDEVDALYERAYQARLSGQRSYASAGGLLEAALGLDKPTFQKPLGYAARFSTVPWSETFSAGRFDAQCFAPDARFYENWLYAHTRCDRLGALLQSTTKGRQQIEAADGSTDYCSIKHINGRELVDVSKCASQPDTPLAGMNDLLLAITGATIGKIAIVKHHARLAFSGDLLCLRANESVDPHYLLLALDHKIGQVQFIRWITGSTNGHLAPRDVMRVMIPRLSSEVEARISGLVKDSLAQRRESEQLLERAKKRVEQLIDEAMQP